MDYCECMRWLPVDESEHRHRHESVTIKPEEGPLTIRMMEDRWDAWMQQGAVFVVVRRRPRDN